MKPLLLLDVDGPLNPYRAKSHRRPAGYETFYTNQSCTLVTPKKTSKQQFLVWYNPKHGEHLKRLSDTATLVWCTSWNHHANTVLAPRLNLDPLPVLDFTDTPKRNTTTHWKTSTIFEYVQDKPFVWVDDELGVRDKRWLSDRVRQPFELYYVNPSKGLTDKNFAELEQTLKNFATA